MGWQSLVPCCTNSFGPIDSNHETEPIEEVRYEDLYVLPTVPHIPRGRLRSANQTYATVEITESWTAPVSRPSPQHLPADIFEQNEQNEYYKSLRAHAAEHAEQMRRCLEQAEADRSWGIREEAGRLFQEANYHKREMESLNAEAAEWIYKENNRPGFSSPGEINLHSLTVQEAVMFTERAIREAQQHGESEIRLVLGRKGHRSHHQRAKLKRTLEDLTRKYNAEAEHGQYHDNVLVVRLGC